MKKRSYNHQEEFLKTLERRDELKKMQEQGSHDPEDVESALKINEILVSLLAKTNKD